MRLWSSASRHLPLVKGVTVHDLDHIGILRLLVTDTFRWKRDWANWRV